MKLNETQRDLISDVLNVNQADVYDDYSGRSMYGKTCFGFTTEQYLNPIQIMVDLTIVLVEEGEEELARTLSKNVCQDNMGLGTITYFPSVQWGEELEEDA